MIGVNKASEVTLMPISAITTAKKSFNFVTSFILARCPPAHCVFRCAVVLHARVDSP
jgi:hypothetical protein